MNPLFIISAVGAETGGIIEVAPIDTIVFAVPLALLAEAAVVAEAAAEAEAEAEEKAVVAPTTPPATTATHPNVTPVTAPAEKPPLFLLPLFTSLDEEEFILEFEDEEEFKLEDEFEEEIEDEFELILELKLEFEL